MQFKDREVVAVGELPRKYERLAMEPSGIITLTTDFGLLDPYAAMMKGVILGINPHARLVDLTHNINAGSISQAAILILEAYSFFPEGTVHVAVVDPGVGSNRRHIGIEAGGHFFVGPDNGIFWPVMEANRHPKVFHLTRTRYFLPSISSTFHGREVFAPVAAHISLGIHLSEMGNTILNPVRLSIPHPRSKGHTLSGQVMRVDNFGNLITNIRRQQLESFLKASQPVITVGKLRLNKLSATYSDGEEGEVLALINSSNLLEIAVNLGRASGCVGLSSDEIIGTQVKINKAS